MSARKLTKKDFEKMLNEKAESLLSLAHLPGIDLTGMDNYFESWKAQKEDARDCGSEGTVFPGYGTWLRKECNLGNDIDHPEFNSRYSDWLNMYA